jgi:hypothetical protein
VIEFDIVPEATQQRRAQGLFTERRGSSPSDRSMKKTVFSSGGSDGFFDSTDLQTEVVGDPGDGIAGSVSLVS